MLYLSKYVKKRYWKKENSTYKAPCRDEYRISDLNNLIKTTKDNITLEYWVVHLLRLDAYKRSKNKTVLVKNVFVIDENVSFLRETFYLQKRHIVLCKYNLSINFTLRLC